MMVEDQAAWRAHIGVPDRAEDYKLPERDQDLGERTGEDMTVLRPFLETFNRSDMTQGPGGIKLGSHVNFVRAMNDIAKMISKK
jgi:hypothetical protein